jgi:microcystin-dependent protein
LAGTFPGVANTQQNDINGQPLAGALLTVYTGGTTQLAVTYQDITTLIPTTNPLVADASGRLPLFYVPDGTYGLRLTDRFGVQSNGGFYLPQVPSIGASTSGGGGTPVDPTTVASTGDIKAAYNNSTIAGWCRLNARTIGNAGSGASERANADTQPLFVFLWNIDPTLVVVGGRGANALADFNGSKQLTLPDMRGRVLAGVDDMGGADSGRLAGSSMTSGRATLGFGGGEGTHTLLQGELSIAVGSTPATHAPGGTFTYDVTSHSNGSAGGFSAVGPGQINQSGGSGVVQTTDVVVPAMSVTNSGGGNGHNNVQPTMLATIYIKL